MTGFFKCLVATSFGVVVLAGSWVLADEVQFKNGDRLTGKIISAEVGKLKIKTTVAGEVEVDLSDVKTFATTGPITLRLKDGTSFTQPVAAAADGQVAVQGGAVAAQNVPLASIKKINPKESWTGAIVAGGLLTRGNSDTDAFNLMIDATRRTDNDRINLNAQYLYGRQRDNSTGDKSTSTDNWRIGGKYDYFFTPKFYGFVSAAIERDRIADLDLRLTPAVGVGYQWAESPRFNFSTEAGLAWVYESYRNQDSNDQISLKLAYHVDKQLHEGVKAFHNFTYFPSLESLSNYFLVTDAGIRADLTEKFFTEFKVEWKYDATPADNSSRSDLRYILGVGWNF